MRFSVCVSMLCQVSSLVRSNVYTLRTIRILNSEPNLTRCQKYVLLIYWCLRVRLRWGIKSWDNSCLVTGETLTLSHWETQRESVSALARHRKVKTAVSKLSNLTQNLCQNWSEQSEISHLENFSLSAELSPSVVPAVLWAGMSPVWRVTKDVVTENISHQVRVGPRGPAGQSLHHQAGREGDRPLEQVGLRDFRDHRQPGPGPLWVLFLCRFQRCVG